MMSSRFAAYTASNTARITFFASKNSTATSPAARLCRSKLPIDSLNRACGLFHRANRKQSFTTRDVCTKPGILHNHWPATAQVGGASIAESIHCSLQRRHSCRRLIRIPAA